MSKFTFTLNFKDNNQHHIKAKDLAKIIDKLNNLSNKMASICFEKQKNNFPKDFLQTKATKQGSFEIVFNINLDLNLLVWQIGALVCLHKFNIKKNSLKFFDFFKIIISKEINEIKEKLQEIDENENILKDKSTLYNVLKPVQNLKNIKIDEVEIAKEDFHKHILEFEAPDEEIFIESLTILTSKQEELDKKWEFKFENGENFWAKISDKKFLNDFKDGKYPLKKSKNSDKIEALISTKTTKDKQEYVIKKIYSFNDKKIKEKSEDDLKDIKEIPKKSINKENQPGLFDEKYLS